VSAFLAAHAAGEPVVLATGGTSGAPRGVVRSTGSWVGSFEAFSRLTGIDPASRVWVPGPLSATMNLFAAVHATMTGARLVGDPRAATHAHVTPSTLTRGLDEGLLGGCTAVVAGDRLAPALHDRAVAAGVRVRHYYGASELSFVAWGSHADDLCPFPGVEVEVRDGEIWVRSPYLCTGYDGDDGDGDNRPAGPLHRDADGFATVGDRGHLREGLLVVAGRPGTATVGGSTVDLAGIEAVLRPAARGEVVVVAVPHPTWGSLPAVVLTRDDDHRPVRRLARSLLHDARRPRVWYQLSALPLTPTGKVDREAVTRLVSAIGDRAGDGSGGPAAARRLG
jgi:long-chain acyl-CoA synthetase